MVEQYYEIQIKHSESESYRTSQWYKTKEEAAKAFDNIASHKGDPQWEGDMFRLLEITKRFVAEVVL